MPDIFTPEQIAQILEEFFKVVGTRQYIGARYVPLFGRKDEDSIEWDNTAPYEPLTIVLYQGNSYTSRQYVPVGVDITNQEFWAITGNYNAQVEMYRRETAAAREIADNALANANAAQEDIDTLLPKVDFSAENTVKKYVDDSVATVQADIDTLLPKADFSAEYTVKDYVDKRVISFNTVSDMVASKRLYVDAICHTNGFHSINDGGAAYYMISDSGTADGMDVIELPNELFAHKVFNDDLSRIVEYNILDYKGDTLDEKWANMAANFLAWQYKHILIPSPREGCEACIKVGNDWKWKVAAPIVFDDSCNCSMVEVYGELYVIGNVNQVLLFDDAAKPENVYFTNGITIRGNRHIGNTIGTAIDIRAGARINFYGQTIINDCDTGVSIGGANQEAPAGAQFDKLHIGFFNNNGIYISGSSHVVEFHCNYVNISCAQRAQLNAIYIGNFTNNIQIGQAIYGTDVAKDGYVTYDANSVIYIDGGSKDVHNITVGFISATNSAYGLYINGGQSKIIYDIMVALIALQTNGIAVYARYAQYMTIGKVKRDNTIDVSNCYHALIQSDLRSNDTIDRFAAFVTKYRVDTTTSIANIPAIANTDRGTITEVNTQYGTKLYYNNGNANIPLDGQMFVPTVTAEELPAAQWYLMGKMYRIASTGSGVNDKLLIGARINNANVWYDLIAGAIYTS